MRKLTTIIVLGMLFALTMPAWAQHRRMMDNQHQNRLSQNDTRTQSGYCGACPYRNGNQSAKLQTNSIAQR
ncbi:MAG: hypothetical protein ACRCVN_04470 [Spirochaetia bacterium]